MFNSKKKIEFNNEELRIVLYALNDFQNKLVATVSISAPTVRLNKKTTAKIETHLLEAARKISQRLGASAEYLPSKEMDE